VAKNLKMSDKVKSRIPELVLESLSKEKRNFSDLLEESIQTEKKLARIEKHQTEKSLEKLKFIKSIKSKLRTSDKDSVAKEIKRLAEYYSNEIHGNFNKFVYNFLHWITPIGLNFMLNSFSLVQFFKNFRGSKELRNKIIIRGNISLVKKLQKFGSLVIVPTHVSNFDSVVISHMIHSAGLNPPMWGAGLNLFKGFTVSYVMNNMGCYKVDRRKKNKIYIETLKQYSKYHLEEGYNSIFFPGGTRSRSGAIEKDLKLGLLSTVVSAFIDNIKRGKIKSNIYVVPVALSYTVVPEAESLALEHYLGSDKKKQILKKIKTKATLLGRMIKKLWNNIMQNNPIYLTFGNPIDPFGNIVNSQGVSIDKYGIPINVTNIIKDEKGNFIDDEQVKKDLTIKLGKKISENFYKINVIMPNQIYLFSIIQCLKNKNPDLKNNELVNLKPESNTITEKDLKEQIGLVIKMVKAKALKEGLKLNSMVRRGDAEKIFNYGTKVYTSGYASKVIDYKRKKIIPKKIATIMYYASRLTCYFETDKEPESIKERAELKKSNTGVERYSG
jgi:glycerol-3-phosphate O-acyltransferase